MPNFTYNTITVIGAQEIASLIGGSNMMTITRVAVGSGVSGSPPLQTGLVNFQMNLTPLPPAVGVNNVQQGEVLVFATLDTANVGASFTWTEMGVFAQIAGQAEFLLAYCQNAGNDAISYQTGLTRSVYNLQIPIDVGYTQNTSVTVLPGSPYYDAPVRSPLGTINVTTPFDSAGRVIEYDIDVANLTGFLPGMVIDYAGGTVPVGFLLCDARQVLRSQFNALFGAISTIYGAGDGTTTFNLPDCRGRTTIGAGQGPGLGAYVLGATLGEEYHKLTTAEMPSHSHTVIEGSGHLHAIADPGHYHNLNDPSHIHNVQGQWTMWNGMNAILNSDPTVTNQFALGLINTNAKTFNGPGPLTGSRSIVNPAYTGITVQTDSTNITQTQKNTTGISIGSSGSNGSHNNIQPSIVFTKIIKY